MPFNSESYQNYLQATSQLQSQFGSDWANKDIYDTGPGTAYQEASPYKLMNPASTGRWMSIIPQAPDNQRGAAQQQFVPWGTTPDASMGYWNGERDSQPEGWQSIYGNGKNNLPGWDRNKYGNIEDYYSDPNDPNKITGTLPGGGDVQSYLNQVKGFQGDYKNYSSAASAPGGWLTPATGLGAVLGAAGIGNLLSGFGSAGNLGDVASSWDSFGGDLTSPFTSGGAAATGGVTDSPFNLPNTPSSLPSFSGPQTTNAPEFGNPFTMPATDQLPNITGPQTTNAVPGLDQVPATSQLPNITGPQTTPATSGIPAGLTDLLKGLAPDAARAIATFFMNQNNASNTNSAAQTVANLGITSLNPDRAQYNSQISNLFSNPGSFFQTNPEYLALADQARQKLDANTAKFGNGGTTNSAYARDIVNAGASTYDQQIKNLLTASGLTFSNSGAGAAAPLFSAGAGQANNQVQGIMDFLGQPAAQQAIRQGTNSLFNTVSSWFTG